MTTDPPDQVRTGRDAGFGSPRAPLLQGRRSRTQDLGKPVRQVAYRVDGAQTDITAGVRLLYDAVLSSPDWDSGLLSTREVLVIARLGLACGFVPDEGTTRAAMEMVGIDPGPVWDRPLHPDPQRSPIRPDALTRYQALLADSCR
jgi:hypothetical protein